MSVQEILLTDCRRGAERLKDLSLNAIITSPPYKDEDGFSWILMEELFSTLHKKLANDGLVFVNFGHLAEHKSRPFRLTCLLEDKIGLRLQETFTWLKTQYRPIQGKRRVNNLTEFVFMFSKKKMPELDRLSIGVPYQDKSNIGRYSDQDLRCRGTLWEIPYETITSSDQKLHNDRFPLDLPLFCLKLANLKPGTLVCDPFVGSGTTALACKELGLDFIGFEKNRTHYETSIKRLNG